MTSPPPLPSERPTGERIASLDLIRGVAILGILIMNVMSFGWVDGAYFNPTEHPGHTPLDLHCWIAAHVLADAKFMTLFAVLFGAGIAIVSERQASLGERFWPFWNKRMLWLLAIGLAHAYLIWEGDVLVSYALCGLIAASLRNLPPKRLFLIGFAALAFGTLIWLGLGGVTRLGLTFKPSLIDQIIVDPSVETTAMQGNWWQQFQWRMTTAITMQLFSFPTFLLWRAGGLMLIGMALQKSGFFAGTLPRRRYWQFLLLGLPAGLAITGLGAWLLLRSDWDTVFSMFEGLLFNYWGSLATASAYASALVLWASSSFLKPIQRVLTAVGRTALSNYLFQSLLGTLIFCGSGLGLFGKLHLIELWGIVASIWLLQIAITLIWLRWFQLGPAEWLWRRLASGKSLPFRREAK